MNSKMAGSSVSHLEEMLHLKKIEPVRQTTAETIDALSRLNTFCRTCSPAAINFGILQEAEGSMVGK